MKNLFKTKNSPIQTALLDCTISTMLSFMKEEKKVSLEIPEMPKNDVASRLISLGFIQSEAAKKFESEMDWWAKRMTENCRAIERAKQQKRDITEARGIWLHARSHFGHNTLLVRFDDFEQIMERFDLVGGPFQKYTGDIPIDVISEIEELESKMFQKPHYVRDLYPIKEVCVTDYEMYRSLRDDPQKKYRRFPFLLNRNDRHSVDKGYFLELGGIVNLFICAPSICMINSSWTLRQVRSSDDPFICAYTDHGILIFTKWGEEANSEILEKYEQLNRLADEVELRSIADRKLN